MPYRPDLLAKADELAQRLGDDHLDLALRLAEMLGNTDRLSQRALRRLVEDYEDGVGSSTRIVTDPGQRHRRDRVIVDHATGPNARTIFEVPGERRNAS